MNDPYPYDILNQSNNRQVRDKMWKYGMVGENVLNSNLDSRCLGHVLVLIQIKCSLDSGQQSNDVRLSWKIV